MAGAHDWPFYSSRGISGTFIGLLGLWSLGEMALLGQMAADYFITLVLYVFFNVAIRLSRFHKT